MSARKLTSTDAFSPVTLQSRTTRLELSAQAVRLHKNGIEFRSRAPIAAWTEMTVGLETPADTKKVQFAGVVVACNGNRHTGYQVSLVFTSVTPKAQVWLSALTLSA